MTPLVDFIRDETGVGEPHIMLTRLFKKIADLIESGGKFEEFMFAQKKNSKYDFLADGKPPIEVVVVVVEERVFGVYRIHGIEAEGSYGTFWSEPLRRFNAEREGPNPEEWARQYRYSKLHSHAEGLLVEGWERPRIPIFRHGDEWFKKILVNREPLVQLPGDLGSGATFAEGAITQVVVNAYERNPEARRLCIQAYSPKCSVCGFDFESAYGPDFAGFIHVHHLRPLSDVGQAYEVDPVKDLRPVCPNCHAAIHHGRELRTIEEVRELLHQHGGRV